MEINKPVDFNLHQLYNDDFVEVDKNIKRFIEEKCGGLVILHGEQGTGKMISFQIENLVTSIHVYLK